MVVIEANNANELFVNIAKQLKSVGVKKSPRGLETIEIQHAMLILRDIKDAVVTLPERNINFKYLQGELDWYESGSLQLKDIEKHSSFWKKIANSDGTVNSNYGYFVYKQLVNGRSQFDWCYEKLQSDANSRQATIAYNQPMHKYDDNKDYVCTLSQSFIINNHGELDSVVHMRSNDLIYGLSYDLPWFTSVQRKLAKKLNVATGNYYHYAMSLHVYKRYYNMLNAIANAGTQ